MTAAVVQGKVGGCETARLEEVNRSLGISRLETMRSSIDSPVRSSHAQQIYAILRVAADYVFSTPDRKKELKQQPKTKAPPVSEVSPTFL